MDPGQDPAATGQPGVRIGSGRLNHQDGSQVAMSTYEGTQMPACSIIIPVYNDAEGLRRCLEALARQSFPIDKAEVIVVDNGSRVSPVEVIAGFGFASLVM